ncbi:nucleotidyltransferase family protein [Ruminococcus sp. OA3]|uniref:nucleotidyltransferase family protein n=1 Tax=Ruminococcus sp. OA3 TaxID=2914164 RepID=UPI001F05BDDD|nr:nucleotidyltransferase family protein [Ruminococcus sp. OA3]MCH1982575.1 nucleotidyltransferase family protein [Ruminococcus sp. OA3]
MKNRFENYTVVIVAAGCSRRMKKFKPLLPLGDGCILESTINSFRHAGLDHIEVVVGYQRHKVIPLLRRMKVHYSENKDYDETDMMESVRIGIRAVRPGTQGILFCPGDVPLIAPETIVRVAETFQEKQPKLLIPTFQGKPGHPPMFSGNVIKGILEYRGEEGLRGVFKRYADSTCFLEVDDEEILQDTDLPGDYERLLRAYDLRQKGR